MMRRTKRLTRFRTTMGVGLCLVLGLGATPAFESPVADAAQRGDLETVRTLLRDGADVNAPQGDGITALHWAAERGDEELAQILLYAGANVEAGTRIGHYTPLHLAAQGGRTPVVELLLRHGANATAASSNAGTQPLHMAASSGDTASIAALANAGAPLDAVETAWGQTPLTFAAARGHAGAIRALVARGADPNHQSYWIDVEERAAADDAADERLEGFLEDLKESEGGGPDWRPTPSQVQAAIEAAREIQRRWPDVPMPEEDGASIGSANAEGETEAGGEGGKEEDEKSAETKGSEDGSEEAEGKEAAEEQPDSTAPRPKSYAQMVERWGGLTPLLHAVRQGHPEAAVALIEGGADVDLPSGGDGTTPLLMATLNGQFDLAKELLRLGADPAASAVAGITPLFATLERQWAPRASYAHPTAHRQQETTHLELLAALLEAGADPNARLTSHLWFMEYTFGVLRGSGIHLEGATPFWRAAYALDVDAMRLLKDHGADPSIPTVKPPERRRRPMQQATEEEEEGSEKGKPLDEDAASEVVQDVVKGEAGEAGESQVDADVAQEGDEGGPIKANAEGESAHEEEDSDEVEEEIDHSGVPPVEVGGPHIAPIHAASGVGYGQSFAGNAHRYVPDNWLAAVRFLVEETGADVNLRDANAFTPLHHAASRGDNELIEYLVSKGADVTVLSRRGQTTADMANGPVQRVPPYPATIDLLVRLGAKNNNKCVSC
ncbi:MAG: hypothetical protein HKN73_01575 [Gemmatimonadetes bacterium]|nr:hypothetical protein [Gemmatimonadota bacterium]